MELEKLLQTRRSFRKFDQSKKIPHNIVKKIIDSQRYASSAGNGQKLRYLVVETEELVEKVFTYTGWGALLPDKKGMPKEGEHPVLFIFVLYDKNDDGPYIGCDTGLAISNMTLTAWNEGVGSIILGNINRNKLQELLEIPENMHIHTAVAFGYPTINSTIVDVEDNLKYYIDEEYNYYVPKLKTEDVATFK